MAHVDRDRGQLILVTGLLIAVAMVSLVLLLNTAIFTENLASRGADQSGREAVEYQSTVVDGVGGIVDEENSREHQSQAAVEDNVTESIELIDNYTARSYATGGTVVRINDSTVDPHPGSLIRQTQPDRNFSNESSTDENWQLVADVENTREFKLDFDDSNLTITEADDARSNGAFHVFLESGSEWEAFIYVNQTTSNIAVATGTGGASTEEQRCSTTENRASVNLTAGTLNGEPCPGLEWADGISGSYDIEYRNAGEINGTYSLVVNSTPPDVNTTNLNDGTSNPTSPYQVPAVYSVTFNLSYSSPTLDYRSEVRVAPGESE